MADRGRSPRSRTRSQAPWDSANPANWTAGKLKSELEKMNITLPAIVLGISDSACTMFEASIMSLFECLSLKVRTRKITA
jgi:hypothetical protein